MKLTTISPVSFILRIQGTPESMMFNISARFVSHASLSEGDATAFARCRFQSANSWCHRSGQ